MDKQIKEIAEKTPSELTTEEFLQLFSSLSKKGRQNVCHWLSTKESPQMVALGESLLVLSKELEKEEGEHNEQK